MNHLNFVRSDHLDEYLKLGYKNVRVSFDKLAGENTPNAEMGNRAILRQGNTYCQLNLFMYFGESTSLMSSLALRRPPVRDVPTSLGCMD